MDYELYVADVETTGLDFDKHDVIELSICKLSDDTQKTWLIRPTNFNTIDEGALRVNGHKLEDLTLKTSYGKKTYQDPHEVIVEVENWVTEDDKPATKRILCGQNVSFDLNMMKKMWEKCDATSSFPFGRRILDTMVIEFFMDFCKESLIDNYSLASLIKKYGIKNEKAHSAAADCLATKQLLLAQVKEFNKTT